MYVVNLPRDEKYHTVRTRAAADLTAAHEAARADVFPESHQHQSVNGARVPEGAFG